MITTTGRKEHTELQKDAAIAAIYDKLFFWKQQERKARSTLGKCQSEIARANEMLEELGVRTPPARGLELTGASNVTRDDLCLHVQIGVLICQILF